MQRSWQALGAGHEHHPHRCPDSRPRQRVDRYRLGVLSRPPIRRAQPERMTQHNSPVCSMGSASVASVRMRSAMMAPDRGSRASSIAERALLHVSTTSCSVSSPTNNLRPGGESVAVQLEPARSSQESLPSGCASRFLYYHIGMAIEFTDSAGKHGFTREDAIHAMQTPEVFTPHFDHSRTSGPDVAAWVGPARGGRTIEVFATLVPPDTVTVFHCMDVRATTIAKLNGERA